MSTPARSVIDELRDLAMRLDRQAGKPPFDYDAYRALVDAECQGKTDEEIEREIAAIKRITPDGSWR